MEKILMNAGILALIILAIVGIVKLFFAKLKLKHPKIFKAVITLITLAFIFGSVTINQLYIVNVKLFTYDTMILLFAVITGVFVTYNGIYEGLGIKQLASKLSSNIKKLVSKNPENKLVKFANKVGLENALGLITELNENSKTNIIPQDDNKI